ncbi:hypothetical protein [Carnobacterium divergens]|uniref:hypothetical protein n=1 Tax=Carnobacterium divergens TaxID=2748 RepID=UPI0028916EDD|nr:hypothetical protein [Carnobacterium divergens]MDT2010828.1 hypothetical protein [Carnobacterium divergens]
MFKNKWLWSGFILIVCLGIGGGIYMSRENDKRESLAIQKDLANYVYNNYVLYTFDKNQETELDKKFDGGKGNMTYRQYSDELNRIAQYSNVEKIEFTGYSITPMNTVKIHFTINDVYKQNVLLDTISAETNKQLYRIGTNQGDGPYYLDDKKETTGEIMPNKNIVYYEGAVK